MACQQSFYFKEQFELFWYWGLESNIQGDKIRFLWKFKPSPPHTSDPGKFPRMVSISSETRGDRYTPPKPSYGPLEQSSPSPLAINNSALSLASSDEEWTAASFSGSN